MVKHNAQHRSNDRIQPQLDQTAILGGQHYLYAAENVEQNPFPADYHLFRSDGL